MARTAISGDNKKGATSMSDLRVSVRYPDGYSIPVSMVLVEERQAEEDVTVICDGWYMPREGQSGEDAIAFLRENTECVRICLPDGVVLYVELSVEGEEPEITLAITPKPLPWRPSKTPGGSWALSFE